MINTINPSGVHESYLIHDLSKHFPSGLFIIRGATTEGY